ncbi:NAD(P)/FAD-dependent oxidoreductase [Marinobacter lacisalsi]|uniref:NAD(P)/FAD-dependent oxidoreductase n=1 Tax=Marinobacter lacisalsi TaxID=475979 RepID=A0ABV8QK76_9GAMM
MIDSRKSHTPLRQVAIVGSGLAGLVAATELRIAGVAVTLFEKSRGPGGRMAAKRLPAPADGSADIGAQYFTVRNPAFRQFLEQYAGNDCWGEWQGRFRYQDDQGSWQDMRPAQRFVGIPRMSAITRAISAGLDVRSGVRIARLQRNDQELWTLTDTEGGTHGGYDAVVLTPPPAQTDELLTDSGLSELADDLNIRISRMQACWTVVVHFPQGSGAGVEGFMPNSSLLNWAANNSSKPGRDDDGEWWVLHGDPDWSDANTDMAPDQVRETLLAEFLRCSGVTAQPDNFLVHRWLYAKPRARTAQGHLWFADQRIAVAGDWLDGGRVEGAFNSAAGLISRLQAEGLISDLAQPR